jgi:hypothetical protein
MTQIMVPKRRAETPVGNGKFTQAEGSWKGTLDAVRVKPFPEFIGKDIDAGRQRGYVSGDGEILSLEIGGQEPLDGQEDAGNRKFFVDLVIRDGDVEISAGPDIPEKSWQMQKSAAMLANLAISLGEVEDVEVEGADGKSEVYVQTKEGFFEALQEGVYNDRLLGYRLRHRNWTSKEKAADGSPMKSGTEVILEEFFTAV